MLPRTYTDPAVKDPDVNNVFAILDPPRYSPADLDPTNRVFTETVSAAWKYDEFSSDTHEAASVPIVVPLTSLTLV